VFAGLEKKESDHKAGKESLNPASASMFMPELKERK